MDHFVGVDLGKLTDPTALSIVTRTLAIDSRGLPELTSRGEYQYRWECRALKRYKLGTEYLEIVDDVLRICCKPELQPDLRLVLDATGVGVAVTEMFTTRLAYYDNVECHTISITAGEGASAVENLSRANVVTRGQWRVSKIQLIAAIRSVLEGRRFKVSKNTDGSPIEFADALKRELTNFREKITESANMTYEARQGQHDDLVLATALPIWLGSQRFCQMEHRVDEASPAHRARESAAIAAEDAEREAMRRAELAALQKEREEAEREREQNFCRPNWAPKYRPPRTAEQKERDRRIEAAIVDGSFFDNPRWGESP